MTCPRCSSPVTVTYSRKGTPRVAAHKCPHGVWCPGPHLTGPLSDYDLCRRCHEPPQIIYGDDRGPDGGNGLNGMGL